MIPIWKLQSNKRQVKINNQKCLFQGHQSSQTLKKDSRHQDQDNIIIMETKCKKDKVLTKIKIKDRINLFRTNKIAKNMYFRVPSQGN